jgi:hypothetical protein
MAARPCLNVSSAELLARIRAEYLEMPGLPTASFAIVDIGQQASHAESAGPDRCLWTSAQMTAAVTS